MKAAVIVFPGSNREGDVVRALGQAGASVTKVWHADEKLPRGTDLAVLPGGFAYGDYLRCGAIAGRAVAMDAVRRHAERGGLVLGICNGFQVLCEAGLLPGALLPNTSLRFVSRQVGVEVVSASTPFTCECAVGDVLSIPAKHTTGRYYHPDPDSLADQVVFRYAPGQNPNGSLADIAGVANEAGNIVGLMPHPEHAVDPLVGSADGGKLFESMAWVPA